MKFLNTHDNIKGGYMVDEVVLSFIDRVACNAVDNDVYNTFTKYDQVSYGYKDDVFPPIKCHGDFSFIFSFNIAEKAYFQGLENFDYLLIT